MEDHGGMLATWENSCFIHQALWQVYQQSSSSTAGRTGEGNYEFGLAKYFCSYFEVFACCKILRHGASSFTSPPKEGGLQMFITLKNPAPQPD
jgi:hypothetical protein